MVDNNKEIGKDPKIDSQSEKSEILEKLNSQEQKFDEFAKKLQSMEKSIAKITKFHKKPKSEKRFVLKHVLEDVTNLEVGDWANSKKEEHFSMEWYMKIKRNASHLEFYVWSEPTADFGDGRSIETKLDFRISGSDYENVIKTTQFCFNDEIGIGYNDFLEWEYIDDFLIDHNLTVEVEVEILKISGSGKDNLMKFDESVADFSDIVLIVNDRKFYLSKYFLALQSSYFKSLLLGNFDESRKKEIELKDIDSDDFQNFLELIHGESSVDDDTVEGILNLADMYDTPTAIRRYEEFLMKNSLKTMPEKFQLSLRYNLENLKNKCLSEITEISTVKSIMAANLPEMDLSTMETLLQKALEFFK